MEQQSSQGMVIYMFKGASMGIGDILIHIELHICVLLILLLIVVNMLKPFVMPLLIVLPMIFKHQWYIQYIPLYHYIPLYQFILLVPTLPLWRCDSQVISIHIALSTETWSRPTSWFQPLSYLRGSELGIDKCVEFKTFQSQRFKISIIIVMDH